MRCSTTWHRRRASVKAGLRCSARACWSNASCGLSCTIRPVWLRVHCGRTGHAVHVSAANTNRPLPSLARHIEGQELADGSLGARRSALGPRPAPVGSGSRASLLSLHLILVHMIAETHRHAGHADILRELIDGDTGR